MYIDDARGPLHSLACLTRSKFALSKLSREFRDVVFEDVGFENNSLLTLNN